MHDITSNWSINYRPWMMKQKEKEPLATNNSVLTGQGGNLHYGYTKMAYEIFLSVIFSSMI